MQLKPQSLKQIEPLAEPIIFYDGVCGVCNIFVQKVVRADKNGIYKFAPIQGETAQRYLGAPVANPDAWSIALIDESGIHEASSAVLRVLRRIRWGFGLPLIGLLVPRPIRDWVYGRVAKYRYRLFGKTDSCQVPSPSLRARMLP